MAYYTTTPLETVYASSMFFPFMALWFVFAMLVFIAYVVIEIETGDIPKLVPSVLSIIAVVSVVWITNITLFSDEKKVYANKQVIGEFAGYVAEGFTEKSGKSRVERHYLYAHYIVEGQNTVIQIDPAASVPKYAYFYRN